ncbi:MAG TPA: 6-carboxytetrahydropterin synthase [Bacteroidia bacterium]|nr:6-carboxytetrahydropterin synthase [Bacteroidia bacterium]
MIYITRREQFSAAHKLFREDWSQEKNYEVFGKCANPNWHGHNYQLFITVKGEQNPDTSFVVNLSDISELAREKVISKLDHRNINLDVDFMKGKMASTETLAIEIWNQLEKPINSLGCKLHCIKVQETENNYVEYFGK